MIAWLKLIPSWGWWLVVLLAVGGGQQVRVAWLQDSLKAEQGARLEDAGKLGACRETRSNLLVQVIEQNGALASMRQAESDRAARAKLAQAEARGQATADYQAANRLQQERTGGDACVAAESVIDQELGL